MTVERAAKPRVFAEPDAGVRPSLRGSRPAILSSRVLAPGLLASAILVGVYLGIITLAQDWDHALEQLRQDLWFIAPITIGFGGQVAMLAYMRALHRSAGTAAAVTAGSTGMSSGAMLACCAHHLSELIPLVGVSGAAIFLNDIKTPLAFVGIAMNGAGALYLATRIRRSIAPRADLARDLADDGLPERKGLGQ